MSEQVTPPTPESADEGFATFRHIATGRSGRITLIVEVGGEQHTDSFDITKADARERTCEAITAKFTGMSIDDVRDELEGIAAQVAEKMMAPVDGADPENPAAILIAIATGDGVELFHSGGRHDAQAYATIKIDKHVETLRVRSPGFAHWLRGQFYEAYKSSPKAEEFAEAINTIEARAMYEGVNRPVHLRVAGDDATGYIDLADDDWNIVKVTAEGWTVISSADCDIRFIRKAGMLPLPIPQRGGSIDELRPFVNCPTDDLWVLFLSWLVSCLRARGPYAVLAMSGEQGSAKSTTCKRAKSLVDPNKAAARRLSRDDRDHMIAAQNGHLLAFDNVSTITAAISDTMCSVATGGGYGTRLLYSDDDEKLIQVCKPQMLNGIDDSASRPDLLDRAVLLHLPTIPEESKREEAEMDAAFEAARPRILGALLEGVSTAIRRLPTTVLSRQPRMLDFAKWCQAAEASFGWKDGTFLDAYMRNRGDAVALAIEGSPVAGAIFKLMESGDAWEGTAAELLTALDAWADKKPADAREWPKSPRGLSDAVRRIAPSMRVLGIDIKTGLKKPGGNRERLIVIRKLAPPPPSGRDGRDEAANALRPAENAPGDAPEGIRDDRDGRDADSGVAGPHEKKHGAIDARDDRDGRVGVAPEEKSPGDPNPPTRPSQPSRPSRNGLGDPEKSDGAGRSGTQRDEDAGWSADILKSCRAGALFDQERGADYD